MCVASSGQAIYSTCDIALIDKKQNQSEKKASSMMIFIDR